MALAAAWMGVTQWKVSLMGQFIIEQIVEWHTFPAAGACALRIDAMLAINT